MELIQIASDLRDALSKLEFSSPVTHVYNPLDYAWDSYCTYLRRYGQPPKEIVLFGMNPGPWGMAQTGVPFGEVAAVRDWLEITDPVRKPSREHPKRPVLGLDCGRSEVSGRRVWGWARQQFGTPALFFERFFIANYCPLMFMEESGRNRTPDKLPARERLTLIQACDKALKETVQVLEPRLVIGIGRFAESRATEALAGMSLETGSILHPSPASPLANRGWEGQATSQLLGLGVEL